MIVTVIGHGQSPLGKGFGTEVDKTTVVRLKDPSWQNKEDYGSRVDYMCSSTETLPCMLDYKRVPKEYWGQPKKGTWNPQTEASFRSRAKAPLKIPIEIFLEWNKVFRQIHKDSEYFNDVPNFSLGMAGIVFSCEFLKPEEIKLLGFDNMLEPSKLDYFKANKGKWVTRHDWLSENKMLPMIEEKYGVKIGAW